MKTAIERLKTEKLISDFRTHLSSIPDPRSPQNTSYHPNDFYLSAFSIFYFQNPSFLAFQNAMKLSKGKHNLQSLFGPVDIPSENQTRTFLDQISPQALFPFFHSLLMTIARFGVLKSFQCFQNGFLVAFDGLQYFSSGEICCKNCTVKEHKNGATTYSHSVVTPVLIAPHQSQTLALPPEFIIPQDGHEKQDCEIEAAKRWIHTHASFYQDWKMTVLGDDLYSRTPFVQLLNSVGWNFILVCKPSSHESLFQAIKDLEEVNEITVVETRKLKGKRSEIETYRFYNGLALYESGELTEVNWCELVVRNEAGKELYKNSWVTNLKVTKKNVEEIAEAGRGRWKIENENNNTLKTKGYHLEHNFGHGEENLSAMMATLNMLAFFFHTILELLEKKYQVLRRNFSSRAIFFEHLKVLTCHQYFENWEDLFLFMLHDFDLEDPDSS